MFVHVRVCFYCALTHKALRICILIAKKISSNTGIPVSPEYFLSLICEHFSNLTKAYLGDLSACGRYNESFIKKEFDRW